MISFKTFIHEMAAPRAADKSKLYFHGTSSEKAGQSILKNGIEPGNIVMPERYKKSKGPNLTPVQGKVYITPDLAYAQMYAIGGDIAGHDMGETGIGYLFVINGNDLRNIDPDEDSIGQLASEAANGNKYSTELRWLANLARQKLTVGQWKKLLDNDYVMYAHAGKKLLPFLSDEQKLQLIDLGAHVAHAGKLIPIKAYKIDLTRTKDLKRDASNFFDVAERVQ